MHDWIIIETFDRVHQAELRKDILEKNGIEAFVVNAKDSLFLVGEIDLYVKRDDEAKAKALIDQFSGLTKINSFILEKQMNEFSNFLHLHDIESTVKRKEDSRFVLDNFEVYIKNEDLSKTLAVITDELPKLWVKLASSSRVRQIRFLIEFLEEKNIPSMVIKKKDSNYHLEEVILYVEKKNLVQANNLITLLNGWIRVETYDQMHRAEIREDLLGKHKIRSIIKKDSETIFHLFVECSNEEAAIDIINKHRNWVKIKTLSTDVEGILLQEKLENKSIPAVVINRKDSLFLVGDVELYVDEYDVEKAIVALQEIDEINE